MKNIETDVLIIGAGPVGLFSVFELGQLGLKCCLVDSLSEIGGQCSALYPEKPIYDIPAYPEIAANELIKKLKEQSNPFKPIFLLNQRVEDLEEINKNFKIKTSNKNIINAKCIILAAGNGVFGPNKPPLDNINKFEGKSIFYSVTNKSIFDNKKVVIAGGGDSAADWAIELANKTEIIYFVHRRSKLRAAPNSVKKLNLLEKKKKLKMIIPYQLDSIKGNNGNLEEVLVRDMEGNLISLQTDYFLPFFGLSTNLGPIKNWELEIEKNEIVINQSTCETSRKGIFAIGDICNYPGKLKLILTGFAEAAIAAHSCYKKIFPDKVLHFEYSTTSGVKKL
ncbi:MAG: NAD(P)/FAD-dependent oxidoreductase [Rickettsiales bacterium TMED254]|nr:ferredoxin--NADP(+) reductase [Rickettsiales bacterium]RPF76438.1 MAG: NAD(P)/FAD-dependent oxidoreductase [Rickettsiales bacterium TMED254]